MNTARDGCRRWGRGEARRTLRSTACQEWVAVSASFRRASHHCGEGKSRPAPGTAKAAGMLADRSATQRQRWPINRDTLPLVPLNNQLLRQRQSLPSISQLVIKTPYSSSTSRQIRGGPGHSSGSQSAQAGCFLASPPRKRWTTPSFLAWSDGKIPDGACCGVADQQKSPGLKPDPPPPQPRLGAHPPAATAPPRHPETSCRNWPPVPPAAAPATHPAPAGCPAAPRSAG